MSHSSWVPASTLPLPTLAAAHTQIPSPPWLSFPHRPSGATDWLCAVASLPRACCGRGEGAAFPGLVWSAQSLTWVLTLSLPLRTHTLLSCRQTSHTASVPARLAPSVGWGEGICRSQSLPRALPSSPRAWHSSAAELHPLTVGLLLQGVDFGGQGR